MEVEARKDFHIGNMDNAWTPDGRYYISIVHREQGEEAIVAVCCDLFTGYTFLWSRRLF